ncbi:MAG: cytochrome b N-terminal domain-containing protein [Bacteroidetes bacterium]|nr:cytochrome b N-terminal domain-containing protein [Bacteroidota bacterium]
MNQKNIESESIKKHTRGHQLFQKFATIIGKIYSTELNPLYYLGGIAVIMFAIACISGIYVFIFYNINPRMAWESVDAMSSNIFNGYMRTIHRYSSDLLIIFMALHFIQVIIVSKFKRLLAWISGVVSIMVVLIIGITGFILVWDQKAKLTGYLTAKLFAALPIFDPSIAGAFLMNDLNTVGGFFKVAVFGHIALSLLTVFIIWIHVMRISKPKIFPPQQLTYYSIIALTVISFVFPVKSDPPAQMSYLPTQTTFDWYYYFGYYFMKVSSSNMNWVYLIVSGAFLTCIPFFFKRKDNPPVRIDLDACDGCNLCAFDCPYEAIDMMNKGGERKAILSPDKCVGCNICIGSCHTHAISHDLFPQLNVQVENQKSDVTLFSCSYFPEPEIPQDLNIKHYRVPCIGSVYPRDVQEMLDNNTKKVALLSCEDCYYRLGKTWTVNRFNRKRAPLFSKKYDAGNVKLFTLTQYSKEKLSDFTKQEVSNNGYNEPGIEDNRKKHHIISVLIMTLFFALMIPLSSTTIHFFNPKEKTLIVNFKYISTPEEYEQNNSGAIHMRTLKPVVKKRSDVMLRIYSSETKQLLYEKEYKPRGIRSDIAMFIYTQLVLNENAVDVEMQEKAFPDVKYRIDNVKLKKGDGTFIIFKEGALQEVK